MNLDEATLERIIEQITRQVLILVQEEQEKAEAGGGDAAHPPISSHNYVERVQHVVNAGADQVVLGCSHYPFLLPVVQRVVGPDVVVVDPSPAIARQTAHVLVDWARVADRDHVGRHVFCTTGAADRFRAMVQQLVPSFWNDT